MSIDDVAYPKTDAEWRARSDAEALARANIIKSDPVRLEKAQVEAAKMAEHDREEANAMSRVAGKKKSSGTSKPSSVKRATGTGSGPSTKNHNVFQKL
jgi:hypothetical protein